MLKNLVKLWLTLLLAFTLSFARYYPNYAEKFSRLLDIKLQRIQQSDKQKQFLKNLYIKLIKVKKQIAQKYHSSKTFLQRQKYKTIYWVLLDWQKVIKEKYSHLKQVDKIWKYTNKNLANYSNWYISNGLDNLSEQQVEVILLNLQKNIFNSIGLWKLNDLLKYKTKKQWMIIDWDLNWKFVLWNSLVWLWKYVISWNINFENLYYLKANGKEQLKWRSYWYWSVEKSWFSYDLTFDLITSGQNSAIKIKNFKYNWFIFNEKIINYLKALNNLSQKYWYLKLWLNRDNKNVLRNLNLENFLSGILNISLFKVYKKEGNKFVLIPWKLLCDIEYLNRWWCYDWHYRNFIKAFTWDYKNWKCRIYFYSVWKDQYKIDFNCKNYKWKEEFKEFYLIINWKGEILKVRLYTKDDKSWWVDVDYQKNKKLLVDIYIFTRYHHYDEIKELPLMKVKITSKGQNFSGTFYELINNYWNKKELVWTVKWVLWDNVRINWTYWKVNDKANYVSFNLYLSPAYSVLIWKKLWLDQYNIYTYLSNSKYIFSGSFFVWWFDIKWKLIYYPNKSYVDAYVKWKYWSINLVDIIAKWRIKKLDNNFYMSWYAFLPKYWNYRYWFGNKIQFSYYVKDHKLTFDKVDEQSRLRVFSTGVIDIDLIFHWTVTKVKKFVIKYPNDAKAISYIVGISMLPTIYDGDIVLEDNPKNIKRWDIVSFYPPVTSYLFFWKKVPYIKRIVGLPWEKIKIDENWNLYICKNWNCKSAKSYWLDLWYVSPLCWIWQFKLTTWYFVMWDDVEFSLDSRCGFKGYYQGSFYKSYLLNTWYSYYKVRKFFANVQVPKKSLISKVSEVYHTSNFIKFDRDWFIDFKGSRDQKTIVYSLAKRYILSNWIDVIKNKVETNWYVKIPMSIAKTNLEKFLLDNADFYIYKIKKSPYYASALYFYIIGVKKWKFINKWILSKIDDNFDYNKYIKIYLLLNNSFDFDDIIDTSINNEIKLSFGGKWLDTIFRKIVIENKTNWRKIICDEYNMKYVCSYLSLYFQKRELKNQEIIIHFEKWNWEKFSKEIK